MLQVVFIGRELLILKELQKCSEVCGVYIRKQRVRPWKLREVLLKNYGFRQLFRPVLQKFSLRKWLRTLESYTIHDYAKENGLRMISAAKIDDAQLLEDIKQINPDLGVVANFGQKVPKTVLESASYGFINFHPSLLPKYRGASPIQHVLLSNDSETGVTWHRMEEALDRGNILSQERITVLPTDTNRDLVIRSVETGQKMLGSLLHSLEHETCEEVPQDESDATYCPRLTRKERKNLDRIIRHLKANSYQLNYLVRVFFITIQSLIVAKYVMMRRDLGRLNFSSYPALKEISACNRGKMVCFVNGIVKCFTFRSQHQCYYRSYALIKFLKLLNINVNFNVGLRNLTTQNDPVRGHCWLTFKGRPVFKHDLASLDLYPIKFDAAQNGIVYWVGKNDQDVIRIKKTRGRSKLKRT